MWDRSEACASGWLTDAVEPGDNRVVVRPAAALPVTGGGDFAHRDRQVAPASSSAPPVRGGARKEVAPARRSSGQHRGLRSPAPPVHSHPRSSPARAARVGPTGVLAEDGAPHAGPVLLSALRRQQRAPPATTAAEEPSVRGGLRRGPLWAPPPVQTLGLVRGLGRAADDDRRYDRRHMPPWQHAAHSSLHKLGPYTAL